MNERTADLLSAVCLIAFALVMRAQLEGIPTEGTIFPLSALYCIMGASLLLALNSLRDHGVISFFSGIPPLRWCAVCGIFLLQVLGAMYVSFLCAMAAGMLAMLLILTPRRTGRALLADLAFVAGFLLFFQLFFTDIMHIYFPENLF